MRTILILPTGLLVVGIILSGVVLNTNNFLLSERDNNDSATLSPEEAISIAVTNPIVLNFVRQTQVSVFTEYDSGVWSVRFTDINSDINYVQVKIDDYTQSIMDTDVSGNTQNLTQEFNYRDSQESSPLSPGIVNEDIAMIGSDERYGFTEPYFYSENQELVNAAIDYFVQNEIVIEYLTTNSMEFYGYSYDNNVYLWGYSVDNYEDWMGASLFAEDISEDAWDFSISEISSGSDFGDAGHSITEAIELVEETNNFKLFAENITEYSINPTVHYYYDSKNEIENYIFNIYYSSYFYYEDYMLDDTNDITTAVDESSNGSSASSSVGSEDPNNTTIIYDYYNPWVDFEVSDDPWGILEIWGPNSAVLSSEEAIEAVLNDSMLQEWFSHVGLVDSYAYYSGYSTWWVDVYDGENPYNYASARLDDRTGKVTEVYTYLSIPATMTEQTINSLIQTNEEAKEFFKTVNQYESNFYYDHYGLWYFSYYEPENYYNYIWGTINDSDGTITSIDVKLYQEPELSESEVLEAIAESGFDNFKAQYPDTIVQTYYDGYDNWYVYGNSLTLGEAWFWALVDDKTSEVINYEENHPKSLPTMEIDEVLVIAHSTNEFKEIAKDVSMYFEYYSFIDGTWYYYLQGTSDEETYYWLTIVISDETGEIGDIWSSSWNYSDNYYTDPDYNEKYGNEIVTSTSQ